MRLIFLVAVLLWPAANAEPAAMTIAFTEGRYSDAAAIARADQDADGYAFAARANLAEAMSASEGEPSPELVETAERLCLSALNIDPKHVEARLQLAIALSLKARPMSSGAALRSGYGEKARQLAESVLRDDPDNFYAHGFMAIWHLEVVRRGGRLGAAMFDASREAARTHYIRARAIRDDDAATHWQYARALAALDHKRHESVIVAALDRALASPVRSELEELMQLRAGELQACMRSQQTCDPKALARSSL